MTVRPRVLLPFIERELDSRSLAAAAQLAALHLSQDPFLYADWDVTFDLNFVELNDTTEDGVHLSPTHACVRRMLHLTDWVSAIRVGARLLREWDGLDALIGGYSTAQLQMQKLFLVQDSELATIGLGNDQRFENYRSLYPRYTSIQGSVIQTLKVR